MHLVGTGCAAPPHAIHQGDAAKMGRSLLQLDPGQERRLAVLYRRAGVESRRSCLLTDDRCTKSRNWLLSQPKRACR